MKEHPLSSADLGLETHVLLVELSNVGFNNSTDKMQTDST